MITAIVHVDVETNRIPEAASDIAEIRGISEVFSVTGDTDLVAVVRVDRHESLADVIADKLSKVQGVTGTKTYLAFRAYSSRDLEAAFSIGAE